MSAIDGVSDIFDPEQWDEVPGFEGLTDLTYHRAKAHGTVRVAFDRPDVHRDDFETLSAKFAAYANLRLLTDEALAAAVAPALR